MNIDEIVVYWIQQIQTNSGHWMHPEDEKLLSLEKHSFNLDFPAGAFVGDILNAPVIILGANGGYDKTITAKEFEETGSIEKFLNRISSPSTVDWSVVSPYYDKVNYGRFLVEGEAVLVNACAYRSQKISEEPENKKLVERLRSVAFTRRWLVEAVLPLAESGERLIVAKRFGMWKLSEATRNTRNVIIEPNPHFMHLSNETKDKIAKFVSS